MISALTRQKQGWYSRKGCNIYFVNYYSRRLKYNHFIIPGTIDQKLFLFYVHEANSNLIGKGFVVRRDTNIN